MTFEGHRPSWSVKRSSWCYVCLYPVLIMPRYNTRMSWGVLLANIVQPKGEADSMNLTECPYCGLAGMVTTIRPGSAGLEVTGKCTICGYSYDTGYDPAEVAHDLPGDDLRPLEIRSAD